VNNLQHNT